MVQITHNLNSPCVSYMCDTCEVNQTRMGFVDSTYMYTSAQQYIGKYNYRDRFTKPV